MVLWERDDGSRHGNTVHLQRNLVPRTLTPHTDLVAYPAEDTYGLKAAPVRWNDRLHFQSVEGRTNAQDVLRNGDVIPGGGPREPGILGFAVRRGVFAGDHLGVDVGLALVQLADLFPRGRINALVVVKCLVAAS